MQVCNYPDADDDDNDDHVYGDDAHEIDYISDCANISCPHLAANVLCIGWPAPYSLLKTDGEQGSVLDK